tara:strand:- start:395 stop:604 length:210 start_codon:yes stop_codon:yes gene_type:complete
MFNLIKNLGAVKFLKGYDIATEIEDLITAIEVPDRDRSYKAYNSRVLRASWRLIEAIRKEAHNGQETKD